jgi:hypothetical protein
MNPTNILEVNAERIRAAIAARTQGGGTRPPVSRMLSQAAHDADTVAELTPTAMIFTPCRDESIVTAPCQAPSCFLNAALRPAYRLAADPVCVRRR